MREVSGIHIRRMGDGYYEIWDEYEGRYVLTKKEVLLLAAALISEATEP